MDLHDNIQQLHIFGLHLDGMTRSTEVPFRTKIKVLFRTNISPNTGHKVQVSTIIAATQSAGTAYP